MSAVRIASVAALCLLAFGCGSSERSPPILGKEGANALPGLPNLAGTAALLPTATGFYAFSARTAAFVPLATSSGVAQTNAAAAPALVYDNASVHCFDARRDRWLSLPRNGTGQPTDSQR